MFLLNERLSMTKRYSLYILFISVLLFMISCETGGEKTGKSNSDLKTEKERFSYAIGLDIASNLERFKEKLDYETVFRAVMDSLTGTDVLLSKKEADSIKSSVFQELRKQETKLKEKQAKENKEIGEAFLKENKKNKDVKVTENGLQYKILKPGKGESPAEDDKVKVHYKGKHLDGKVFDSSRERGKPSAFPVNKVIKGWQEALQLMKEGAEWRIFVPAEMAYGKRGAKKEIEPNETLIFDIELLEIMENKKAPSKERLTRQKRNPGKNKKGENLKK